ncbi:UTRA domain-containing protein [Streptomyces palmae]|uniref:UTRA domain-containing protein n=1 Tax=Streptomyces palmae TaxID=1701085 RepID=A0A4Z0H9R9_9ACTN|nr:UTRA domain-containing protein [Streptomyces palmae]
MTTEGTDGQPEYEHAIRPLRRRGVQRLARELWGQGRSIWSADLGDRELLVDQAGVTEAPAPAAVAQVLGVEPGTRVCVRGHRYLLERKPVLLATSYLPADLVAGSAITEEDTGPGGIYARLAELGYRPAHFREEIRCRMPSQDEADRLELGAGTPVVHISRTAFAGDGRPVEVNEMVLDSGAYVLEYDFDA